MRMQDDTESFLIAFWSIFHWSIHLNLFLFSVNKVPVTKSHSHSLNVKSLTDLTFTEVH